MRIPHVGRGWVALILVIAIILVSVRLLDSSLRLDSYRLLDPQTLLVEGDGARGAWVHVTDVVEGTSTVTISVNVFTFTPGPSTSGGTRWGPWWPWRRRSATGPSSTAARASP
ncbi:MAG: hypothetical protein ACRDGL_09005 [Candidatus Limnocylindrales bacterium]